MRKKRGLLIAENFLEYQEMDINGLINAYRRRCKELNSYLDKLEQKGILRRDNARRADDRKIYDSRKTLIRRLVELDTRILAGQFLENNEKEKDLIFTLEG